MKNLKIERVFTFPNKDPYEMCEVPMPVEERIRDLVTNICNKGEKLNYFNEDEAFQFEAELAYALLYRLIDELFVVIRIKSFCHHDKFYSKEFFQTVLLATTSIAILSSNKA